jgi:hypothetical protein
VASPASSSSSALGLGVFGVVAGSGVCVFGGVAVERGGGQTAGSAN